MINSDFFSF